MKKYKICVYAICKNEGKFIERWYNSIKDADYICVLDTGSVSSIIDSRVLDKLQYTEIEGKSIGYGVDGVEHHMDRVGIVLTYKDKDYPDVFRVLDMSASFDALKRDSGVTVHGFLSSTFFERYKYVLNYNELVAYSMI